MKRGTFVCSFWFKELAIIDIYQIIILLINNNEHFLFFILFLLNK